MSLYEAHVHDQHTSRLDNDPESGFMLSMDPTTNVWAFTNTHGPGGSKEDPCIYGHEDISAVKQTGIHDPIGSHDK